MAHTKSSLLRPQFEPVPVLTLCALLITVTVSCLERFYPALLHFLWRDPVALSHNQWWRLLSPLLAQPDPWPQAVSVFLLFLVVGTLSERLWTKAAWLSLYLAGGLAGEIAGYMWQPYGAGMSVAGAGLLGAFATSMISRAPAWPVKFGGGLILLGGLTLAWRSDIHGPPILVGSLIAALMIRYGRHSFVRSRRTRCIVETRAKDLENRSAKCNADVGLTTNLEHNKTEQPHRQRNTFRLWLESTKASLLTNHQTSSRGSTRGSVCELYRQA